MKNTNDTKRGLLKLNDLDQKLELDYPCTWSYKLIANHEDHTKEAVFDVVCDRTHSLKHSNKSKSGKYVSMNLELLVHNEDDKNFIYEALKAHQKIKMVL